MPGVAMAVVYQLAGLLLLATTLLQLAVSVSAAYDPTTRLYLDAYLATPELREQGRNLSLVPAFPLTPNEPNFSLLPFPLHSGYFQSVPDCHFFFQLFSPTNTSSSSSPSPLIVWLAGGPGIAGSFWTLLGGYTPLVYSSPPAGTGGSARFSVSNQSWALDAHVLVVDFPASVGFSHCTAEQPVLPSNVSQAAEQLLPFLTSFFVLFPELAYGDLYVAGHSFGARHAADLSALLLRAGLPVMGCIVESGLQSAASFSRICEMTYQQGRMASSELLACQASYNAWAIAAVARNEGVAVAAGYDVVSAVQRANSGGLSYFDTQRGFRYPPQPFAFLPLRLALHAGYTTPYTYTASISYSDAYSGESVDTLDEVLADGRRSRVLYMTDDTDQLHGVSAQLMLGATRYASRTDWGNRTRAEALRVAGATVTRGFVKRDDRLWFAMVWNTGHAMSTTQPHAIGQLVRDFIRAGRAERAEGLVEAPAAAAAPQGSSRPSLAAQLAPHGAAAALPRTPTAALPTQPVISPAVYLTPFLNMGANGVRLAQEASAVTLPSQSVLAANSSYAGYITIDPALGSHSFLWLVRSLDGNASAPLILHLSGGPGYSSMAMGMMYQHGPLELIPGSSDPLAVRRRVDSYAEHCHVLYVDSPMGTGFSYTEDRRGIRATSQQVADDVYELLKQFYFLFPELASSRLYLHGVSYAGHFLPALGAKIHRENLRRAPAQRMPLEGLLIASGYMDVPSQLSQETDLYAAIGRTDVFHPFDVVGCTGRSCDLDSWNYVEPNDWDEAEPAIMAYLTHPAVLSALHTGERGLRMQAYNGTVGRAMNNDPSVKPEVEELLASGSYRVALYTAEYDIICAASGVLNFVASLNYTAAVQWETRSIKSWQQADGGVQPHVQPPYTTTLWPVSPPQPNAIWWQYHDDLTLSYALIRYAGHLIERTHLHQTGLVVSRIMQLPTLPKPQQLQPVWSSSSSSSTAAATAAASSSFSSSLPPPPPPVESSSSTGEGPTEEEGDSHRGLVISAVLLLCSCVVIGVCGAVQVRKERREKEERKRGSLHASLLNDGMGSTQL